MELKGKRIVITGLTGQVGTPVAAALAAENQVIGLARFAAPGSQAAAEALGIECHAIDFTDPDFEGVPNDVDVILNFAVMKAGKWHRDLPGNAEAAGMLMSHFRSAEVMLHCSSTAVYRPQGVEPLTEQDPLGDHHQHAMPTYSISKIAAETVVRFAAREFDLPTVIARLNVPYGDGGGWPLFHLLMLEAGQPIVMHTDGAAYNPIHDDDILADLPALLDLAAVPAPTVNWAGSEIVTIEEWSRYMAELAGVDATFETTEFTIPSAAISNAAREAHLSPTTVDWRDGFRRMFEAHRSRTATN